MVTPSEHSPGVNHQRVYKKYTIGVFKVLALENVCWGAAKFHDTKLWEAELFLWLSSMVVSFRGSRRGCAASVAAGMSPEGKDYEPSCLLLGLRKRNCFKVDFFALKPVCKI